MTYGLMTHLPMMRRLFPATLALLAALAAPACAQAQAGAPEALEAAQQALYQDALLALSEGRRTDASRALQRLIEQEPRHAGAWLDLALIQCSLGNADEAERLFATIETRFEPSRGILELISQTREEGCRPWTPSSSLALTFGRGIDHNVNQGASTSTLKLGDGSLELPLLDDFLPKRDDYTVAGVEYLRDLTPNGTIGFAQLQSRRNDALRNYDTDSLFGGIESPWRFGKWVLRSTLVAGTVTLGGHSYQRQAQGQLRVTPPLSLPSNTVFNLMAGHTWTNYRRLANFDARTMELRPELSYRRSSVYASASLGLLNDHGDAQRPGGNRHGQLLNLLVRAALPGGLTGEAGYTRQTWRSARPYAPELLIPQTRDQATQVLRGTLTYPINKNHSLVFDARAVRNRENIEIFQYNNRQFQLSWRWQP
ncbi:tetratricopeptide repeat protein [Massilia sp. TN1-12]|uniref:tetratricopeptide repeat protein n=1 Tax=Massilia paldalensis TaxID=3377675 RepID=UPI00384AA8C5